MQLMKHFSSRWSRAGRGPHPTPLPACPDDDASDVRLQPARDVSQTRKS